MDFPFARPPAVATPSLPPNWVRLSFTVKLPKSPTSVFLIVIPEVESRTSAISFRSEFVFELRGTSVSFVAGFWHANPAIKRHNIGSRCFIAIFIFVFDRRYCYPTDQRIFGWLGRVIRIGVTHNNLSPHSDLMTVFFNKSKISFGSIFCPVFFLISLRIVSITGSVHSI